jgi:hypothetical protein
MSNPKADISSVKKPKQLAAESTARVPARVATHRRYPSGLMLCESGADPLVPQPGARTVTLLRLRPLFTCQRSGRRSRRGPVFYQTL